MSRLSAIQSIVVAAALLSLSCLARSQQQPPPTTMSTDSTLAIAPAPPTEALYDGYALSVNGRDVPVYQCRVSAIPFNQVWPGYQRPIEQTELAGFACWDMSGPVDVVVESKRPVKSVSIKPSSRGIVPSVEGNRIRFRMPAAGQITVEVNGPHHALHLFANPPEVDVPRADDPSVRYFGPGVHQIGRTSVASNQTIYIAPGAVVYGSFQGQGVSNVRIRGRGIIDVSQMERSQGRGALRFSDSTNISVEGVIMRDPDIWCFTLSGCTNVDIANVKLIGLWRYNADGIDICNSQNVTVRDSFVRAFDDNIVLKGLKARSGISFDDRPIINVRVSNCVLWNDWGRALEIGAETAAPEFSNIVFENCDIIRTCHIAMDIQHGDRAVIRDVRFENIRVEIDDTNPTPVFQTSREHKYDPGDGSYVPELMVIVLRQNYYSRDTDRGTVRNITFRNIEVTAPRTPPSSFRGLDEAHDVRGVSIENLRINGRRVDSAKDAGLEIGPFVSEVRFVNP